MDWLELAFRWVQACLDEKYFFHFNLVLPCQVKHDWKRPVLGYMEWIWEKSASMVAAVHMTLSAGATCALEAIQMLCSRSMCCRVDREWWDCMQSQSCASLGLQNQGRRTKMMILQEWQRIQRLIPQWLLKRWRPGIQPRPGPNLAFLYGIWTKVAGRVYLD